MTPFSLLYLPNEGTEGDEVGPRGAFEALRGEGWLSAYTAFSYGVEARHDGPAGALRRLEALLAEAQPRVLLWQHVGNFPVTRRQLATLRTASPETHWVYHEGDAYGRWAKRLPASTRALLASADTVALVGLGQLAALARSAGARRIVYSPSAVDAVRFGRPWTPPADRELDVVLIGNRTTSRLPFARFPGSTRREALVRALGRRFGTRFAVYGRGWEGFAGDRGPLAYADQEAALRRARVSVGWNHFDTVEAYFSDRLPISLLSGVPHVTNHQPGYEALFGPDAPLRWAHGVDEAVAEVEGLLDLGPAVLDALGRRAQALARERFTAGPVYRRLLEEALDVAPGTAPHAAAETKASAQAPAGSTVGGRAGLDLHLGMLGPISAADYREFLHPGAWRDGLPRGMGATPVNLLCRELLARGQRLTIFTLDPSVRDEVVLEGDRLRICIGPYAQPAGRRPARDFFAAERAYLAGAVRRERPDLLHAQWTYEYALAAQATGLPHLITAHDATLSVLRHELIPYRVAHSLMAWRVLSRARRVVSVSPHVAAHLRRFMRYRGETEVIPNGMAQSLFDRTRPPRLLNGPVTYGTLLNVWSGLKNGRAALEAFALVRRSRPDDRLVMLGYDHGPGEPAEAWARRRGLAAGVRFAGYMAHGAALSFLADEVDVLVHPSREESFGLTLVEASALGIPSIAGARSGAVPWTVAGGDAGLLVDVTSPPAIAEAMVRLAGDAALREDLGRRARANALERFHIRVVADAYQRIYAELAGRLS